MATKSSPDEQASPLEWAQWLLAQPVRTFWQALLVRQVRNECYRGLTDQKLLGWLYQVRQYFSRLQASRPDELEAFLFYRPDERIGLELVGYGLHELAWDRLARYVTLGVRPAWRGQGYGRRILHGLVSRCLNWPQRILGLVQTALLENKPLNQLLQDWQVREQGPNFTLYEWPRYQQPNDKLRIYWIE